ncbi:MAG: DinB family protein [Gemmatimonadota bacterium]|nr:MAG: DinB family protein [Gemmatimonadota bacterium]
MPISEALIPELDQEAAATRRLLERVPEDKLDWKPHEKSMSLGRLATHLAELPGWGKVTIEQDVLDIGGFQPTILKTVSEMVGLFDKNVSEFRVILGETPDAEFMKTWTMKHEGKEVFAAPKIAVVRNMVMNHLVHHRGQLTVFLRLNDVPLPMIYGPSADETGGL